ncbi:MAG: hypothetical protein EOO65_04925 [Methanosarcinales archaeon]|nr:MAG: hypothetical protein EOO65_04925 [Methanosarcinales archaeon]
MQIRGYKSTEAWYGIKTSSITRFLEASQGCQRDFKGDAKARYMKYDGVYLRLLLLWSYMDGTKLERIKYWFVLLPATTMHCAWPTNMLFGGAKPRGNTRVPHHTTARTAG